MVAQFPGGGEERHSRIAGSDAVRHAAASPLDEARNALRQFNLGMALLDDWLARPPGGFRLKVSHLLALNRAAVEGVMRDAGTFRTVGIKISNSAHVPPPAADVPALVDDLCDYVNEHFERCSAVHLAAYALWRLNWIHPFSDGNGRTSRMISYVILCARLRCRLPGANTIPEQIAHAKSLYYEALEDGDRALAQGRIDLGSMEKLLSGCLAQQLLDVHDAANGVLALQRSDQNGALAAAGAIRAAPPVAVVKDPPPTALRASRNWIERNSALVTAVATILAAIIGVALTYLLGK